MRQHQKNPKIRERYSGVTTGGRYDGRIKMLPHNIFLPTDRKKPAAWLVLTDLFHPGVSDAFIRNVFQCFASTPQHIFLVLTKRPGRVRKVVRWGTDNVWIGTTVESEAQRKRIDTVKRIPLFRKFLSVEPLLGPIVDLYGDLEGIDWVVVGGESGPGARPCEVGWIQEVMQNCWRAGIPVFVKQLGNNDGVRRHRTKRGKAEEVRKALGLRRGKAGLADFRAVPDIEVLRGETNKGGTKHD